MEIAFVASKRSHDPQTKHGAVIVNKENIIMGVGYNGFPKGRDDSKLCNVRPGKYLLINHAEANAIANCLVKPKTEDKARCYVSGFPCIDCVKQLYLHNVNTIIHADRQGSAIFTTEYWQEWFAVVEYLGMDIRRL